MKTKCILQLDGGTYPGVVRQSLGGVGRNHVDALTRLGNDVHFISSIGNDENGQFFLQNSKHFRVCYKTILKLTNK
jgi:pseudouridine kinase